MASLDIVIVSSSPPRQFTNYSMPSSSPLPSLSELRQKKAPVLWTGSRATPIPQYASASFTSAASLFKSAKDLLGAEGIRSFELNAEDNGNTEELPVPKVKPRKPSTNKSKDPEGKEKVAKVPRKTAAKKDTIDGEVQEKKARKSKAKVIEKDGDKNAVKEPVARKPRAKKVDKESNGDEAKPARKSRAKKVDDDAQTKMPKGQVTKPSEKVSRSKKSEPELDPFTNSVDYGLVEAVKRRTDWTPPVPTARAADITPVSQLDLGVMSDLSHQSVENTKGFADLFGNFGFSKLDSSTTEKKTLDTIAPRKRKLIELVKTSVSTAAAVSQEKKPKKKAKTITEQATSPYVEEIPTRPAPLLQYFSHQTTERSTKDGFKIPAKPRSKSPVKAKRGSAEAPILLSPESALKQSGKQDFVFGTSSQLAREDSPTLLRDLHEAMQASNNEFDDDDPFADSIDSVLLPLTNRTQPLAKRNLWAAASRDSAGDLLEVEMVDLVNSPIAPRQQTPEVRPAAGESVKTPAKLDFWHDIDAVDLAQSTQPDKEELKVGPVEAAIRAELLSSPPGSRKTNDSSPSGSKGKQRAASPSKPSQSPAKTSTKAVKSSDLQKPDFSSYTMAQLQKEIASYRFKPVKNRDQMITLLEKCWEGKNRVALGALGTNVLSTAPIESSKPTVPASSQMSASSPKRPPGRPRKDSTAVSPPKAKIGRPRKNSVIESPKAKVGRPKKVNTIKYLEMDSDTPLSQIRTPKRSKKKAKEAVEDISDSDVQITPSPPRRRASQTKSPTLKLKLSTSIDVDTSPELSPTSSQALLFTHITLAVKNAIRSKDISAPSWYEKILLYDPIILEDLTVWLNTGALEKAGWDGEVEPKEVKKWCESKSVCCLWRENLRGGARSRY